jgi:hypothetical protein
MGARSFTWASGSINDEGALSEEAAVTALRSAAEAAPWSR